MTPCETLGFLIVASHRQRKYRTERRRWAWSIHRPYSEDYNRPPPGELDIPEEEDA